MIQICPAILVKNNKDFKDQITKYTKLFDTIDIDINIEGDDFDGAVTYDPEKEFIEIQKYPETNFNIHLMVSEPSEMISAYKTLHQTAKVKFLIHQEADFHKAIENHNDVDIGIVVKAESRMRDIDFYNQFNEVQLMTIITGKQGNPFIPEILERVEWLREEGFKGKISLDGSVNLQTSQIIKEFDVSRVSVGSYFSKAEDLELNLQKLQLALNM